MQILRHKNFILSPAVRLSQWQREKPVRISEDNVMKIARRVAISGSLYTTYTHTHHQLIG